MSDIEIRKAANEYWSATLLEKSDGLDSYHLGVLDAFAAGVKWARAQWPITPRTAEEAKPEDFGQALGLMWADLGKKLEEVSIWCGALEGQANRIDREQRAMIVDVGQKVEAVISLVDDLDELIRSEVGEAIEVAREDEAYRPAVGMFGIGGDASVVSFVPKASDARDYEERPEKPLRPGVMGVDPASPDGDETVMIAQDGEGRMHPITPPGWAGKIRDVFIHNNQLFVQCEAGLFAHFGGKTLTPLEFGA